MDDGKCAGRGHRYAIEIVNAMKVCVGGDFGIDVCWAHHIQCFFRLLYLSAPQMK